MVNIMGKNRLESHSAGVTASLRRLPGSGKETVLPSTQDDKDYGVALDLRPKM
jgi:hypothetical protein